MILLHWVIFINNAEKINSFEQLRVSPLPNARQLIMSLVKWIKLIRYILKFSQLTKAKRGDDLIKMSFETNLNLKIAKKSKKETENRKRKGKK